MGSQLPAVLQKAIKGHSREREKPTSYIKGPNYLVQMGDKVFKNAEARRAAVRDPLVHISVFG